MIKRTDQSRISNYREKVRLLHSKWRPHPGQEKILRAIFNEGKRRVFIQAGRKFGKSELCMYAAWRVATLVANAQTYIVGPTRRQQSEILWDNDRIQTFGPDFKQIEYKSELRIRFPEWRSFIKIDGSENFDSYRGTEYDLMILDEFKDIDPRFYDAAYPNLLSKNGILIVIGTPPDREGHYTRLMREVQTDTDWVHFHGTSWENPYLPGGHEWLKRERKKYFERGDERLWQIEYEAKFIPGGANAVFPVFNRDKHVRPHSDILAEIERDRHKLHWYTVSDPGSSTCFCVLFIAYNPYNSKIYVLDEIYEQDRMRTTAISIWKRVLEMQKELYPVLLPEKWNNLYDSAASWFQNEVASYFGHGLSPVKKKQGEKESEVSLIKDAMLTSQICLSDRVVKCLYEIENYVTDETGKYPDFEDHSIDCLRYFFQASGFTIDAQKALGLSSEDGPRFYTPEQDLRALRQREDPFSGLFDDPYDA